MPARPPVADVIKFEFIQTLASTRNVVNITYAAFSGGGGVDSDLLNVATAVHGHFGTRFLGHLNSDLVLVETIATDLTTDISPRVTYTSTVAGAGGGTALTANTALAISWGISRRYRGGHPRMYLCGLETDMLADPSHWASGTLTTFDTAANDFLSDVGSSGHGTYTSLTPVNVSYFTGGALRVTPVIDGITGASVHSRVDSQRRRSGKETT